MSDRPRLAGDGRLVLPARVVVDRKGHVRWRPSERTVDPFDRTGDRLLLAESFARLDARHRATARRWFAEHGGVDVAAVTRRHEVPWAGFRGRRPADEIADAIVGIEEEQANVRWHLGTLERLSARRDDRQWDPTWGQVLVSHEGDHLIVGGPHGGEEIASRRRIDAGGDRATPSDPMARSLLDAERARRRATEDWPTVTVGGYVLDDTPLSRDASVLGTTWDRMVELETILLTPFVREAAERTLTITLEPEEADRGGRRVLSTRERRTWRSVLYPIHLQLFESLRRITEGEPGAATCRECGRPFLVLDARRRHFCNGRERICFNQREFRRRHEGKPRSPS